MRSGRDCSKLHIIVRLPNRLHRCNKPFTLAFQSSATQPGKCSSVVQVKECLLEALVRLTCGPPGSAFSTHAATLAARVAPLAS